MARRVQKAMRATIGVIPPAISNSLSDALNFPSAFPQRSAARCLPFGVFALKSNGIVMLSRIASMAKMHDFPSAQGFYARPAISVVDAAPQLRDTRREPAIGNPDDGDFRGQGADFRRVRHGGELARQHRARGQGLSRAEGL